MTRIYAHDALFTYAHSKIWYSCFYFSFCPSHFLFPVDFFYVIPLRMHKRFRTFVKQLSKEKKHFNPCRWEIFGVFSREVGLFFKAHKLILICFDFFFFYYQMDQSVRVNLLNIDDCNVYLWVWSTSTWSIILSTLFYALMVFNLIHCELMRI